MDRPELVIFDCDGTLVDTEELNCRGLSILLERQFGLTQYDHLTVLDRFCGVGLPDIFPVIAAENNVNIPDNIGDVFADTVEEHAHIYLKRVHNIEKVVQLAKAHGPIAVGSNGQRLNVVSSVRTAGLLDYFGEDNVHTAADVARGKPAPDLFLHIAQKHNADPAKTIVIEDTPTGVKAGAAAGMIVFGVVYAWHEDLTERGAILKKAGADKIFYSSAALLEEFETIYRDAKAA